MSQPDPAANAARRRDADYNDALLDENAMADEKRARSAASSSEMTPTEIELAEFFGPPDFLLAAEQFDAENGAGAAAELLRLAKENSAAGLPPCPFCGGELCSVVLGQEHGNVAGVSCGGCGAYTSRLPWREPWLYEGAQRG